MPTDNREGWAVPAEAKQAMSDLKSDLKSEIEAPTSPSLSFGQKLVGLTFNPSGDPKVNKAKELCAELADLLHKDYYESAASALKVQLFNHTIGEILNAQMNVVKVLTLKY